MGELNAAHNEPRRDWAATRRPELTDGRSLFRSSGERPGDQSGAAMVR